MRQAANLKPDHASEQISGTRLRRSEKTRCTVTYERCCMHAQSVKKTRQPQRFLVCVGLHGPQAETMD